MRTSTALVAPAIAALLILAGCATKLTSHPVPEHPASFDLPENWSIRYGKDCSESALACMSNTFSNLNRSGSTQCYYNRLSQRKSLSSWLDEAKQSQSGNKRRFGTLLSNGKQIAFSHSWGDLDSYAYYYPDSDSTAYSLVCVQVGSCSWGSQYCSFEEFDGLGRKIAP